MKPRRREELCSPQRVRKGMGRSRSRRARLVRPARLALLSVVVTGVLTAVGIGIGAPASAGSPIASAHAARVLNVRDNGRLHYVRSSGELIIDEGHATGSFPGWVKVSFLYNGEPTIGARFTIYGSGGSISARGTARLSSPTSSSPSFRGSMTITGGSGRYAHVHGGGELYGVYYRRSYALTVQAIGKLPY
jgi:hypothetical protein